MLENLSINILLFASIKAMGQKNRIDVENIS